ncbi:hypothetical protein [Pseudomonas laurylsulfatiphila]|uniref:hypothetical protein n=1 Tax=Pseudomonas laurylsulfatiphila TaxID=2011015 RepID=UPI003D1DEA63|nr:hypothetical protein [Pseudomonas reinekei]MDF9905257.1 hypothetical protein [Pseudomonas reinekei]
MSGISTIVNFGCLSDEQRWDAQRYDWNWLTELDEHDRDIVNLLDCLSDGEFSGQASAVQFHDLLLTEVREGYPKSLANDWGQILAYVNIIAYEEMRHGIALATAYHYVSTGELGYVDKLSVREYSEKYIWCYEDRKYWDLYSYTFAHLFGEVVNTELYRDVRSQVHHPALQALITNIMKDEARHTQAWAAVIEEMVKSDPAHLERSLAVIDVGLTYHNAMVHETYFEGQNKLMQLFLPAKRGEGAVDRIVRKKTQLMEQIFGAQNPYTQEQMRAQHVSFLVKGLGQTRAVHSPESEDGILFLQN